MKTTKDKIQFTKKDIGKTFDMYWCGHWNKVKIRYIEDDWYGNKNADVCVYNINLNSRTVIPNEFNIKEIK